MLCTRATGYFKPNTSEQDTSGAKSQLPLAAQFMNVKARTLHVAARALRIVPTRTLTAHDGETPVLTRSKDKFIEAIRCCSREHFPGCCHRAAEIERRHDSRHRASPTISNYQKE